MLPDFGANKLKVHGKLQYDSVKLNSIGGNYRKSYKSTMRLEPLYKVMFRPATENAIR